MRRTYAYNSIYFGLLFGAAIGVMTNSVALGIISGIIITVIFFMLIRAMENAISKKTDKFVSSITRKLDEKHLKNVQTQQVVSNVQTQQAVYNVQSQQTADNVQSHQPINDVHTQQSASVEVIDCEWVCPKCGTKLDEECLFCPNCGNEVANNSGHQFIEQDKKSANEALNANNISNVSPTTSNSHMNDSSIFRNHKVIGIISILLSSISVIYYIYEFLREPISNYLTFYSVLGFFCNPLLLSLAFLVIWFIFLISLLTKNKAIRLLSFALIPSTCWCNIYDVLAHVRSSWDFRKNMLHYFAGLCPFILIVIVCVILIIWTLKKNPRSIVLMNVLITIMLLATFLVRLMYNNTGRF